MQVRKSGVMQHKINKFIMLTDEMMMFNVHYNLGQLFLPATMREYLKIELQLHKLAPYDSCTLKHFCRGQGGI